MTLVGFFWKGFRHIYTFKVLGIRTVNNRFPSPFQSPYSAYSLHPLLNALPSPTRKSATRCRRSYAVIPRCHFYKDCCKIRSFVRSVNISMCMLSQFSKSFTYVRVASIPENVVVQTQSLKMKYFTLATSVLLTTRNYPFNIIQITT